MPTINDLRQQAATIKNATQVGENTATRVGTTFETIADLLEGASVGQGVPSVDLSQLNSLRTPADQTTTSPTVYNVTTLHNLSSTTIKVGTLFIFSDGGRAVVTQILLSNYQVDGGGNISSPNTSQITMYYRMFNIVQETWSAWTLYAGGGGGGTIDPYPVSGSDNAVASNGVFEGLQKAAPEVDINDIDDLGDFVDMRTGEASTYTIKAYHNLSSTWLRVGVLMVFANQANNTLTQICISNCMVDGGGNLIPNYTTNVMNVFYRFKQFSGNPPEGMTIGVWTTWAKFGDSGYQPDNEDIDLNANDQLQFANKAYDASAFSGLGRVYLRKNIVELNLTDKYFDGFMSNVLVQDVGTSSTPDEICFDTTRKMFVARVGLSWYLDWSSDEEYNPIMGDVNWNYNGNFYRWNGRELAQWDKTINQLTQAMVNTANTIYHIQYDYDLNGETITIPEGCLLEFEGGSLGNGSVKANELNVISNGKCFNNIKFVGACKNRSYVNLSWFIDKYPTSTQDLSIDNTNDFKMCVSSGAHNIVVPTNKFIHLTDTIEFTEATNLLVESNNDTNFEAFSSGDSSNYEQFTSPCIFSKEVVRLFDYKVANHTETDTSNPITIGGFNIYVDVPFSELTDSSIKTPIINVESAGADIWGLNIDTNIRIKRHGVSVPVAQQKDGRTIDLVCNYTGILLNANNGHMSMVRINGNIYGAHYCIRTISNTESSKNWFTDLILNGSTYGAYGGIFSVTPVSIYNNHQTHIMPNEYNTTGYFNGSIIRCYGFVWDCGMTSPRSKWKSAAVPVRFGANINDQFIVQALDENTGYYRQYPTVITRTRDILKEKADAFYNILRDWMSPLRRDLCAIQSFTYTFDGVDIFTHPELVVNSDRLFNEFYNKENGQQSTTSRFAAYTANYVSSIHIEFVLNTMLLTGNGNREMPLFIFRMFRNTRKYSVSISYCSTIDGTYIEFVNRSDVSASYYPFNEYVYQLNQGDGYYKITIDLSSINGVLPAMIVPQFNRPFTELMAGTTTNRPNIVSARFGVPYFDTSVNKPVYWNGSNWYDALGNRDISDGTVQYSRISKVAREAKHTLRIEMDSPSNLFILKIGTISRESVFLVNTTTATTGGLTTVRSVTLLAGSVKCGDFIYFKDTAANKHVIECTSTQKLGDYEDYYIFPITTGTITIQGLDSSSYDESTCKGETPIAVVFGNVGSAPSIMPWTGSSMFSINLGIPIFGDGYSRAVNALGQSAAKIRGTSGQRPILTENNDKGYCYFDTGLGTPIWWNGTLWINQDGISIATKRNGTKAQRPSGSSIYVGFQYLQVDSTNGTFPIWASAISGDTVTWVKADGSNPDA